MKKKIIGNKRLTKRTIIEPEEGDDFIELMIESFRAAGLPEKTLKGNKITFGQTFKEWLEETLEDEKQILKDKGLPHEYIVWKIPAKEDNKFLYQSQRPNDAKKYEFIHLPDYMEKIKGYDIGSMECLTARIIERVCRLLEHEISKEDEGRLKDAYFLGEIIMKRNVYALESPRQTKNAKKTRNILIPLIEKLAKREGKPSELWYDLITMMEEEDLSPEESINEGKKQVSYSYYNKHKGKYLDKKYLYATFSNRLREFRKKNPR